MDLESKNLLTQSFHKSTGGLNQSTSFITFAARIISFKSKTVSFDYPPEAKLDEVKYSGYVLWHETQKLQQSLNFVQWHKYYAIGSGVQ